MSDNLLTINEAVQFINDIYKKNILQGNTDKSKVPEADSLDDVPR